MVRSTVSRGPRTTDGSGAAPPQRTAPPLIESERVIATMLDLTAALNGCHTEDGVARLMAEQAAALCGAECASVGLWDGTALRLASVHRDGGWREVAYQSPATGSISHYVLTTGQPYLSNDLANDPLTDQQADRALGVHSELAVAIPGGGGRVLGGVALYNKAGDAPFTEADQRALMALAAQAGVALERVRSVADLARTVLALRSSEARYRELVENANDIVYTHDLSGRFTSVNRAAELASGLTQDQILTMNIAQIIEPESLTRALEMTRRKLAGEQHPPYTVRMRAVNGSLVTLEVNTRLLSEDGIVVGVQGIARDVTARTEAERLRRESEERLQRIIETSPDMICVLDPDGCYVFANTAYERILGVRPTDLIGRRMWEFMHPDDAACIESLQRFRALADADQPLDTGPYDYTFRSRNADGRWLVTEARLKVLLDADARLSGVLVISRDITERRRAEDALAGHNRILRQLSENAPLDSLLQETCATLDALLGEDRCAIWTLTDDGLHLRCATVPNVPHHRDLSDAARDARTLQAGAEAHAGVTRSIAEVLQPRQPTRYGDADAAQPPHTSWSAIIPDIGGETMLGVITVYTSSDCEPEVWKLQVVEEMCRLASVVIRTSRADAALRASEARFRALVQHSADVIGVVDAAGLIRYVSPSVLAALGHAPEHLMGSAAVDLIAPADRARLRAQFAALTAVPGGYATMQARVLHRDRSPRDFDIEAMNLLDEPGVRGIVINARDVTERNALAEQLTRQAFQDALTGLPNRALFMDRLGTALTRAARSGHMTSVLFLDLDRFKVVNDSLGHATGDDLLVEVGRRLTACFRPGDTVARFGGDEFMVLVEDVQHESEALLAAERAIRALRRPVRLGRHETYISASVGIACVTGGSAQPDELLRHADIALYGAKAAGKNRALIFNQQMSARAHGQLSLETDLRHAIRRGELALYYQPVIELTDGGIRSVEALLRWHHPQRGLVPPSAFLPLAEELGVSGDLWEWVLAEACSQAAAWRRTARAESAPVVSVNLSPRHLQQADLVRQIERAVRAANLPPQALRLEVTEDAVLHDTDATLATMHALRSLGVGLALDDFGSGYSSLSYLRRFPVDTLKLDRSFIADLGSDAATRAVVTAICTLAHTLGMSVTAEGIETADQLDQARAVGCDRGQGFYFAQPLPADQVVLDADIAR